MVFLALPALFPRPARSRSLAQGAQGRWVSPGLGRALSHPALRSAPPALPRLPATLKFPRRTERKREEKAFHHRCPEPVYKNLAPPLPGSLAGSEGSRHSPCGHRDGSGRRAAPKSGLAGKPSPWESAPRLANPRLTSPRAPAPAPGVFSAISR